MGGPQPAVEPEGLRDLESLGSCTLEGLPPSLSLPSSLPVLVAPALQRLPQGTPLPQAWGSLGASGEQSLGVCSEFLACLCGAHVLPLPLRKRGARGFA